MLAMPAGSSGSSSFAENSTADDSETQGIWVIASQASEMQVALFYFKIGNAIGLIGAPVAPVMFIGAATNTNS